MRSLMALLALSVACLSLAQGGSAGGIGGGGFGGGGLQGGQQGRLNQQYDGSIGWIESRLGRYLDGDPVKNLMTPGEYSEWKLTMKAGQVIIAEAWSEAFDPALQVIDDKEKVLASNDDRFPGDQRPLLLWRCPKDGEYAIRARCFADKFGGQFLFRSNVYKSIDAVEGGTVDYESSSNERFLVRMPLKAGEIRRIAVEIPRENGFLPASLSNAISPIGLPDVELTSGMNEAIGSAVMASVDGDYYVVAQPGNNGKGKVRIKTALQAVVPMNSSGAVRSGKARTNAASLWTMSAKKGELIEVTATGLHLQGAFILSERPDISDKSLKDEKKNPFFPKVPVEDEVDKGPALSELPGRARDTRRRVFYVLRDCELWLGSGGFGPGDTDYTVTAKPANTEYAVGGPNEGTLKIGNTDYWSFDAKSGDVMTFKAEFEGFSQIVTLYDPDLGNVFSTLAPPDQKGSDWNLIVRKPGRYFVAVSAFGNGASGTYALTREVFAARTFDKTTPAVGDFSTGQAEVWKFTARPNEPLFIHWSSLNSNYSVDIRDENGNNLSLPLTSVDGSNQYGILKVDRERTYVIVLISRGGRSDYKIELGDIPGYTRKGD